jgi:hypothetical protein
MNNNCGTEMISKEIEQLFKNVEEFIINKDLWVDSIKYSYLSTSTNN